MRELRVIDAVRLETRVFRQPSSAGYVETRGVAAGDEVVPLVAPDAFALRLVDLDNDG